MNLAPLIQLSGRTRPIKDFFCFVHSKKIFYRSSTFAKLNWGGQGSWDRFSLKQVIKFNFFRSEKGGVFSNLEKINFITRFNLKFFHNSRESRWAILKIGFSRWAKNKKCYIYRKGGKKLGSGGPGSGIPLHSQDNPPLWGRSKIKN